MGNELAVTGGQRQSAISSTLDVVSNFATIREMSQVLMRSGMMPNSIKSPEAAMTIMLKGFELGLPPMVAIDGIDIIQGKATVKPQLMLAMIKGTGQLESMDVKDTEKSCTVTMKRKGEAKPYTDTFTDDDAKAMGLIDKDNWKKQRKVMRRWRTIAAVCRLAFADIIGGLYIPDEMGAETNAEGNFIRAEVVETLPYKGEEPESNAHLATREQIGEFSDKLKGMLAALQAKYLKTWEPIFGPRLEQGLSVPFGKEMIVMEIFQASGHLAKWMVGTNRLPAGSDLAVLYYRSDKDRDQIKGEMTGYFNLKAEEHRRSVFAKHPELDPDLPSQEPAEPIEAEVVPDQGDAFEGDVYLGPEHQGF